MRDYIDRRVTPPNRVTRPIWGTPPPKMRCIWMTSLKYGLKSVSVFAFTNKLKLVMKDNELELSIASLTTCNFITVQSNR